MNKENIWLGFIQALADYGKHGQPDELLLDLDSENSLKQLENMCEKFPSLVRSAEVWKSKRNHHARIELWHDIEPMEALLLQSCFGSDPVREFLCFLRIQNGIKEPSRLFTPKIREIKEVFP